jgi:protein ImuA
LPAKGFRPGTLVEWLAYDEAHREDGVSLSPGDPGNVSTGSGAATLAFLAAGEALRRSEARASPGAVVVLDPWGEFYPPAAVRWGLDPARLIVVHPGNRADYQWAFDQALRCSCVAAAIAWPDAVRRQQPQQGSSSRKGAGVNGHTFRRWQLAAEGGGGLGLMIRPLCARHEPSWADVRMLVEPLPAAAPHGAARRLRVTLLRCRGGMQERVVELEIPT